MALNFAFARRDLESPELPLTMTRPAVMWLARRLLRQSDRDKLFRALRIATADGLSEQDALEFVHDAVTGKGGILARVSPLALLCVHIHFSIRQLGLPLGKVLVEWLPRRFAVLFAAASSIGLTPAYYEAIEQREESVKAAKRILAKGYFNFAFIMTILIGFPYAFHYFIVGLLRETQAGLKGIGVAIAFRGPGGDFLVISEFIFDYLLIILAGLGLLVLAVAMSRPVLTGPARRVLDGIFPFDLYRLITGADLLSSMAVMVSGGVRPQRTLEAVAENSTPYLLEKISCIRQADSDILGSLDQIPGHWPDYETRVYARLLKRDPNPGKSLRSLSQQLIQTVERRAVFYSELFSNLAGLSLVLFTVAALLATDSLMKSFTNLSP